MEKKGSKTDEAEETEDSKGPGDLEGMEREFFIHHEVEKIVQDYGIDPDYDEATKFIRDIFHFCDEMRRNPEQDWNGWRKEDLEMILNLLRRVSEEWHYYIDDIYNALKTNRVDEGTVCVDISAELQLVDDLMREIAEIVSADISDELKAVEKLQGDVEKIANLSATDELESVEELQRDVEEIVNLSDTDELESVEERSMRRLAASMGVVPGDFKRN